MTDHETLTVANQFADYRGAVRLAYGHLAAAAATRDWPTLVRSMDGFTALILAWEPVDGLCTCGDHTPDR